MTLNSDQVSVFAAAALAAVSLWLVLRHTRLGREMRENAAKYGPPPLSSQVLMGPSMKERLANVAAALERAIIAPIEMIARAV